MANTEIIPVIDLGPYLAGASGAINRTAEELRFALTEIGFYFIVNHGVPSEQIQAVFRQAARFHALPLEKKLEVKLDKHNVGYLPIRGDTLRTSTVETVTKANINEAFFVARDLPSDHPEVLADRRFRSANRWPAGLPSFREPIVAYCETMEQLVRLYACALRLPLEYFDQPFEEPQYKLRMTHYPYRTDLANDEFGIARHTDIEALPDPEPQPDPKPPSKQEVVIAMLRLPEGVDEVASVTGWQRHTVRGVFSGTLKKKLGLTLASAKRSAAGSTASPSRRTYETSTPRRFGSPALWRAVLRSRSSRHPEGPTAKPGPGQS
jgi:hypothetical protein